MGPLPWIFGRVLAALLTTLIVSVLSYVLIRVLYPEAFGDPRPLLEQAADFTEGLVLRFDLGISQYQQIPVTDLVWRGLPVDIALFAGALAFGIVTGVLAGVACARRPRRLVDRALTAAALLVL